MIGYLTGRMGASQRDAEEMMETLFHMDMSLGSISAQEAAVSTALAEPVRAAQDYVQQQPVQNVDETSWRERTQLIWLWISATPLVTVFILIATRGAGPSPSEGRHGRRPGQGAKQLLGIITPSDFVHGIVGSDRWSGYNWLDPQQRQVCWAHLKRDFQALVDRGGESAPMAQPLERAARPKRATFGQALLEQVERMFGLWHRIREGGPLRGHGTLSQLDFQTAMQPIQTRVGELLREGSVLPCAKTRHTCANILKLEVALWTFVRVAGVEPTNNAAERP